MLRDKRFGCAVFGSRVSKGLGAWVHRLPRPSNVVRFCSPKKSPNQKAIPNPKRNYIGGSK